jgi:hypothetical protein
MNAVAGSGDGAWFGNGVSPQRTCALVIGIERYDTDRTWDLDGPASDAARFTSWLLSRGVPTDQILVFLSPLEDKPPGVPLPAGVTASPARREPVTSAITRTLPESRGDLLWLFWAGHGVLTRDDHLRLFFADATTDDKRNLDLSSLLTALRSDRYAGFPRQIGVVDACQTYADRLQLATTLPAETLPYGQPLPGREQFFLYAASPGQVAVNLGSVRAGLFSQAVMAELTGAGGDGWPPDMDLVAAGLDRRFSDLRAAGRASQTPTSFRWRPWPGGERILGETVPEPAGAAAAARVWPPSGAVLREAVDQLLNLNVMADALTRASIVRRLRKGLATTIPYDPASRPHVVNIVTRCLDYPGGLAELIGAVELYADPADPALAEAEAATARLAGETGQEFGRDE